ncbi:hypothetical protein [Kitasatospora sp. NPDC087314]
MVRVPDDGRLVVLAARHTVTLARILETRVVDERLRGAGELCTTRARAPF